MTKKSKRRMQKSLIGYKTERGFAAFESYGGGELKDLHCPKCKSLLDAATQVGGPNDTGPDDGSIAICISCGEAMQFEVLGGVYGFRHLPLIELLAMRLDQNFWKLYGASLQKRTKYGQRSN